MAEQQFYGSVGHAAGRDLHLHCYQCTAEQCPLVRVMRWQWLALLAELILHRWF